MGLGVALPGEMGVSWDCWNCSSASFPLENGFGGRPSLSRRTALDWSISSIRVLSNCRLHTQTHRQTDTDRLTHTW